MSERTCTNAPCSKPHYARGLCRRCYDKQRNNGDPNYVRPAPKMIEGLRESDWQKIDKAADGCWLWIGAVSRLHGYGRVRADGVTANAHRYVWTMLVGSVPDGLELDHLCRVRRCVNPAHLEPVTHLENVMRGEAPSRYNAAKATCARGHAYDRVRRGKRICTTCENDNARKREKSRVRQPR